MTQETYYRLDEQGEYQPVRYYDSNLMDSMPVGYHLISVYPGGSCSRYNVNPDHVAVLAALRQGKDLVTDTLLQAQQLRPNHRAATKEQREAWQRMLDAFPEDTHGIRPSCQEAADKMVVCLTQQVEDMLERNPQLRGAHERFRMLAALCEHTP